jgi:hypothetical protein
MARVDAALPNPVDLQLPPEQAALFVMFVS